MGQQEDADIIDLPSEAPLTLSIFKDSDLSPQDCSAVLRCYEHWMAYKKSSKPDTEPSCCDRRALLRGMGAAGLLMLGRCSTSGAKAPEGVDRGLVAADGGVAAADAGTPLVDTSFVGSDGGLPPIDLVAPTVIQTATFALG